MDNQEILARFEEDLWQSSPHTVKHRLYYAKMWLDFANRPPEQWDRQVVIRFMKKLVEGNGYSKGSQRLLYTIVKRVFDAARVDWPMGKRGAPKVQPSEVVKPSLDLDRGRVMIEAAKDGRLAEDETAFLALSTTYGVRREELVRVGPADIDYKKGTIYVRTVKGGIERYQLLAPEIVPFLERHDFNKAYSLSKMSALYRVIEAKVGLEHIEDSGWHSPRRAIDTILVQWSYIYCKIFLRWKLQSDMALAYVTLNPLEVDRAVFEQAHPFLPMWR